MGPLIEDADYQVVNKPEYMKYVYRLVKLVTNTMCLLGVVFTFSAVYYYFGGDKYQRAMTAYFIEVASQAEVVQGRNNFRANKRWEGQMAFGESWYTN